MDRPKLTETIVFMAPIEFPFTEKHERINNAFEGMKIRDRQEGHF